jgi:hypothetical protein
MTTGLPRPEKIYGRFDAEGKPAGFWTSDIYPPDEDGALNAAIPAEAGEISFATWETLLGNHLARYTNGTISYVEAPPIPPPVPDVAFVEAQRANARLDDGVSAAVTVAEDVRDAVHAIPSGFTGANFAALLLQMKVMSDAFVAMLQAQAPPAPPS